MTTKFFTLVILLTVFSLSSTALEKKTVKSKLNEATVFFQGAELTHSASTTLNKGENEIYIEGLSPQIDKNSLKIKTSNGVIVSAHEFSVDFLSSAKAASAVSEKLLDSINIYRKRLEDINTTIKINEELINLLKKGTDKNVSGSEKGLGIDELVKTMEYYKTKAAELESTLATSEKKKSEIRKAIERLEKQYNQESLKNNKTSGVLKLNLSSPTTTTADFTITYYTPAANWVPYYDINIASTDKPVKIVSKAKVRQTTGLDWEKVRLNLSTATPSNGKIAPLFSTWFLDFQGYGSQLRGRAAGVATQNSFSYDKAAELSEVVVAYGIAKESKAVLKQTIQPLYMVDGTPVDADYYNSLDQSMIKESSFIDGNTATKTYGSGAAGGVYVATLKSSMDDYITQAENDLNMTFNIDIPYTIPGNGKEQSIELQTKETVAEYKYYCAPRLDTETYLLAEISNWQQLNLLSGKANITYDGTYVGESLIDASSTHEKLTLTLGTDKRVVVKREKMQDFSSTKFLGSDTKQVFTYKLTVKNNQNKPIRMVLKDQYPISTQKSIEVELLVKDTTPWTVNKEDLGVITWEEEIKAGETKVYQISYSVKYPKGSNLNL